MITRHLKTHLKGNLSGTPGQVVSSSDSRCYQQHRIGLSRTTSSGGPPSSAFSPAPSNGGSTSKQEVQRRFSLAPPGGRGASVPTSPCHYRPRSHLTVAFPHSPTGSDTQTQQTYQPHGGVRMPSPFSPATASWMVTSTTGSGGAFLPLAPAPGNNSSSSNWHNANSECQQEDTNLRLQDEVVAEAFLRRLKLQSTSSEHPP